jgi:NAD(P)-dependent dehydrogenase (short-subunit alcohol dehydrogenase family)
MLEDIEEIVPSMETKEPIGAQRVVVITGASAGVGRAAAREFARRGDSVALLARGQNGLAAAKREVEDLGGHAVVVPTDVADYDEIEAAADLVECELGSIDVWVNNAMTTVFSPFRDITPEEYRRATEVTYLGVVYGTMAALRRMAQRDRGTIVQVGSALSYRAIPLQAPYCGAKHAIRGFTDSLRCELLHDGSRIHVTMVQLPALNTPQFSWCKSRLPNHPQPVPPIFQPEVAARAIVWAADHRRREVLVGRTAVWTIWLNKFLPGLGDRYLAKNGYKDQQTDRPIDPNRPINLFNPVPGDHGAHGIFDDRANDRSWQWSLTTHRGYVALAVAGTLAVLIGIVAAI